MTDRPAEALSSPATARNRDPILEALRPRLPDGSEVLEIASGAGEHAVHIAAALPRIVWRPSDRDESALASIRAWRAASGLANLAEPVALDASRPDDWPVARADAIVCINMVHISPWAASEGLMAGAARILPPGGLLYLYGPYREASRPTAPSNEAFDADLRRRNPAWGLRLVDDVATLAQQRGLILEERIEMPANNLSLIFRRT